MGESRTLNYSRESALRGGLLSLHHVIAAAGGVTSKDRQIPLSSPRGGIQRCQATYAKLLQAGIAKGGAGCKRSAQAEQLLLVSADHCKQINALKGTADKHGQ